jgi:hypothetical protein
MENAQQVGYEEDQQYGAEPDPSAASHAPAAMAVVASTAAKNQYQDDD